MKKKFNLFLFACLALFPCTFQAQTLQLTGYGSARTLLMDGRPVEMPRDVFQSVVSHSPVVAVLPDGKSLVYQVGMNIRYWKYGTAEGKPLMSLLESSEGQSAPVVRWWDDNDETFIVFVNLNEKQYKHGTCIFVLRMKDGELIEKMKFEKPVAHEPGKPPVADTDFGIDGLKEVHYYVANQAEPFEEGAIELDFTERLKKSGRTMGLALVGFEASSFYYELHDLNHQKIPLPEEVESAIFDVYAAISPDERYMVYDAPDNSIQLFDFKTRQTVSLMTLLDGSEGYHEFAWTDQSDKIAFVNINQSAYGTKVFALTIRDGKLADKQKFDAKVNYVCGGICLSVPNGDFWWESPNRIGYLLPQAVEENEGKKAFIDLNP